MAQTITSYAGPVLVVRIGSFSGHLPGHQQKQHNTNGGKSANKF
jgi:hypothetical protein